MSKKLDGFFLMIPVECGLTKKQLLNLVNSLPDNDDEYIPFSLFGNSNSAIHGFVKNELYDDCPRKSEEWNHIEVVLDNWQLERDDKTYSLMDGKYHIRIDCEYETIK